MEEKWQNCQEVSCVHNSASSERSGPVTAGAAAGLTAGTGAAFGAGAAAFFFPSSHAWMYLKHEIRILMKIKTRNTVPIPIIVYTVAVFNRVPIEVSSATPADISVN